MHGRRRFVRWILPLVAALAGAACREQPASSVTSQQRPASRVSTAELAAAIDRSAHYLAGLCDERGQFTYRTNLDPGIETEPAYNELRHAGAVYALAQYCQRSPDPAVRDAMGRGAQFLRREFLGPVAGNPQMLAAWLTPELSGDDQPRQAKLGGTGLALVALLSAEQVAPGSTPLDELRALGRFVIFMQKSDGTFYSKFFPDAGRSDAWQSDYYPGEAALGLLMLYAKDPAPQWLRTAAKALDAMARRGSAGRPTFPDQWFLLATERMMQLEPDDSLPMSRDAVLAHARRICEDMLSEQKRQVGHPRIAGCYTRDGRSCPTATRLEGLLAAIGFLPSGDPKPHTQIRESIDDGMRFLLSCQITAGPHAGAFPRVLPGYQQPDNVSDKQRAQEVRIDYVQHALSAMMRFETEFQKDKIVR
jgi:hypothetical protein